MSSTRLEILEKARTEIETVLMENAGVKRIKFRGKEVEYGNLLEMLEVLDQRIAKVKQSESPTIAPRRNYARLTR